MDVNSIEGAFASFRRSSSPRSPAMSLDKRRKLNEDDGIHPSVRGALDASGQQHAASSSSIVRINLPPELLCVILKHVQLPLLVKYVKTPSDSALSSLLFPSEFYFPSRFSANIRIISVVQHVHDSCLGRKCPTANLMATCPTSLRSLHMNYGLIYLYPCS